jgi:hypothetical protein
MNDDAVANHPINLGPGGSKVDPSKPCLEWRLEWHLGERTPCEATAVTLVNIGDTTVFDETVAQVDELMRKALIGA